MYLDLTMGVGEMRLLKGDERVEATNGGGLVSKNSGVLPSMPVYSLSLLPGRRKTTTPRVGWNGKEQKDLEKKERTPP